MPLTAERLYKANEQYASELSKALTATSSSGAALQPEDLEPALVEELFRLQPLLALMPIKQATARVHEIARRTAHGKARFEGDGVAVVVAETRARAEDGDHQWLASPMCDSYHTVWMRLHEDLLGFLGITREEEAVQLERA